MTLDEAVTIVRARITDFTHLVHSDVDLKNLLEQGACDVAALTLCYERKTVYTHVDSPQAFVVGGREYLIAGDVGLGGLGLTDVHRILSVHVNTKPLVQITPEGFTMSRIGGTAAATPEFWYEYAGRLGFRPSPSTAFLTDYTLEISYAASVGAWTSGECVLPPAFDELVVSYAYSKALMREGQWEEALSMLIEWFKDVQSQAIVLQAPETQKSGPPQAPTQRRDQQRQKR